MMKVFGVWILTDKEMNQLLGQAVYCSHVAEASRWFNPYKQFKPLFEYLHGKSRIETARAETLSNLGIKE